MTDDKPPQYTAFRAPKNDEGAAPETASAPQSQPPEEDELSRRANLWRAKWPQRAEALRRVVGPLLGYSPQSTLSPRLVAAICEPIESKILGAVYGVEEVEK